MKRIILIASLLLSSLVHAGPNSIVFTQRNAADTGNVLRTPQQPAVDALVYFNVATNLPAYWTLGPGLSVMNGVLSATSTPGATGPQGPVGPQGAPGPQGSMGAQGPKGDTGAQGPIGLTGAAGAAGPKGDKGDTGATGAQGIQGVQGPAGTPAPTFNFGMPTARTLAVSTSYQATNTAKPAVITISPSCSASLTLSGGSTCTLQARIGTAPMTCSGGVIVATWTNGNTGALTVGLSLNQIVGSPYALNLPTGAAFVLCPVSGTFTISAAEQTAG